jgi:hypothetical protein
MSTALEWPPPGLEAIHRRIHRLTTRAWIATLLLCPLVLWLLFDAPGLDPRRGGSGIVALIALAGILAFLSAIAGAAGVIDQMRRARRLGYSTDVITDVATDTTGDAAAAWSGTGAMSDVRDVTRTRALSLRRTAALLSALAAILPPPLLAFSMLLALRGAASFAAVLAIALLPSLLALITALTLRGYALLLVQWDRGSAQWDPDPVTVEDRAREWIARTHAPPARHPANAAQFVLIVVAAFLGIGIFIFTAFTTAAAISAGVSMRTVDPAAVSAMISIGGESPLYLNLARRERLPLDTTMDPQLAGALVHQALYAGVAVGDAVMPVPDSANVPWPKLHRNARPDRSSLRVWHAALADSAIADSLAAPLHPSVDAALRVARVRDADVFGARFRNDVPLPLMSLFEWEGGNAAALLQGGIVARAAHAAREGRYDDAEHDLRSLISFGFVLMENSPAAADYVRGASLVRQGHLALGRLRALRGDSATARTLELLEEAGASRYQPPQGDRSLSGLRRRATGEAGAPRAHRWQAAFGLAMVERCGSLRAVLFGPRERAEHFQPMLHNALVRFPSEQRLFDVLHNPEENTMSLPRVPMPRRWAGTRIMEAVLGERHARSICFALARM